MGKIQHLQIRFHPAVSVRRPRVLAVRLSGGRRQGRTCRPPLTSLMGQGKPLRHHRGGAASTCPWGWLWGSRRRRRRRRRCRRQRRRPVRNALSDRAEMWVKLLLGQISLYGPTKPRPNVNVSSLGGRDFFFLDKEMQITYTSVISSI